MPGVKYWILVCTFADKAGCFVVGPYSAASSMSAHIIPYCTDSPITILMMITRPSPASPMSHLTGVGMFQLLDCRNHSTDPDQIFNSCYLCQMKAKLKNFSSLAYG